MLQFVGLLLQWLQTLHSLDLFLKIPSGINNLSSDKLEYSEKVSQPFDAADNCRLYVTTMKAMIFQVDISSIPIGNFKDHYVLVFDLNSMQDAIENCHYPERVGEPLKLELNFIFPLEHVSELFVLGERMSSVAIDKFGVARKKIWNGIFFLLQTINRIPLLKYRYRGSVPSDFVPNHDNDTFANIKTQPNYMQGEHWIKIKTSRQVLYFADSLGRKKYSFLKQEYEQMTPEPLLSHRSICGF